MAAISTIVLNDAASTPLAHTFKPARQGLVGNNSVTDFEDRDANTGIPVGFFRVSTEFSRPSNDRKSYRVKLKLSTPVLEVTSNSTVSGIAPAPTVSYTPLCQIEFVVPERSSLQVRKDLRKMAYQLLNDTTIVNLVENLDVPY